MLKRTLLGALAVFVVWAVLDFVIHVVILAGVYGRTREMWRPEGEMKMGLMYVVLAIAALSFAYLYARFVERKSLATAALFGLVYGIGTGVSMGYGSYSVMPIPYVLAFGWFAGGVVEAVAGGIAVGLVIRE